MILENWIIVNYSYLGASLIISKWSLKACCSFSVFDVGEILYYKEWSSWNDDKKKRQLLKAGYRLVFRWGCASSFSVGESWKQGSDKRAKGWDTLIMSPVMINCILFKFFNYNMLYVLQCDRFGKHSINAWIKYKQVHISYMFYHEYHSMVYQIKVITKTE